MEDRSQDTIASTVCEECSDRSSSCTEILEGGIMVLPTDTGNTVTCGLISNLKHRMDSTSQSFRVELTELSRWVKRLEDKYNTTMSAQATLPNHEEQLVKLQEDNAAQAKVIVDLKERLCKIEAKQQSARGGTVDLPAFKQRIDDLINTLVPTIPKMDLDDSIKSPEVQMRRDTPKRSSCKRMSRPLSDYYEFSHHRSGSMSSTTSSGYKSVGVLHQDSIESHMGLNSIREQDSTPVSTAATPNLVSSTTHTGDSIDYLTDPHALKSTVVDTLWSMGDLLDILSSLMPSINKEGVSQQDLREPNT